MQPPSSLSNLSEITESQEQELRRHRPPRHQMAVQGSQASQAQPLYGVGGDAPCDDVPRRRSSCSRSPPRDPQPPSHRWPPALRDLLPPEPAPPKLPISERPHQPEPQPDRLDSRRWWRAVPASVRSTNIHRAARGLVWPRQDRQVLKVFSLGVPCSPPVKARHENYQPSLPLLYLPAFLTNSPPFATQVSHPVDVSASYLVNGKRWLVFGNALTGQFRAGGTSGTLARFFPSPSVRKSQAGSPEQRFTMPRKQQRSRIAKVPQKSAPISANR